MNVRYIYSFISLTLFSFCYAPDVKLDIAHAAVSEQDGPLQSPTETEELERPFSINDDDNETQPFQLDEYQEQKPQQAPDPFAQEYGAQIRQWLKHEEETTGLGEKQSKQNDNEDDQNQEKLEQQKEKEAAELQADVELENIYRV